MDTGKRASREYSQPFFRAQHGSSALHGKDENGMGAWCLHSWETSRICFLSMAWEGTVQSQNCKEGALKWAQTQCWGCCAVKHCHLQMRKLGLGAPDGFRKRRNAVLESNMKYRAESGRCARRWPIFSEIHVRRFANDWTGILLGIRTQVRAWYGGLAASLGHDTEEDHVARL